MPVCDTTQLSGLQVVAFGDLATVKGLNQVATLATDNVIAANGAGTAAKVKVVGLAGQPVYSAYQ